MERCGDCVRRVEAANAVLQSENAHLRSQLTVKSEARTETPPTGDLIPHRRGSRFLVVASTRGRGRKGRSRGRSHRHKGRSHRHKGRSRRHKGRSRRHKGRSRRHKGRSRMHKGRSRRHKGRSRRHKGRSRRR
jgi:hypothetical protein